MLLTSNEPWYFCTDFIRFIKTSADSAEEEKRKEKGVQGVDTRRKENGGKDNEKRMKRKRGKGRGGKE